MESDAIVSASVRTVERVIQRPAAVVVRLAFAVNFVRTDVPPVGLLP